MGLLARFDPAHHPFNPRREKEPVGLQIRVAHVANHRRRFTRQHMYRQPGLLALGIPCCRVLSRGSKQCPTVKTDPGKLTLPQTTVKCLFRFALGEKIPVAHLHRTIQRCRQRLQKSPQIRQIRWTKGRRQLQKEWTQHTVQRSQSVHKRPYRLLAAP